VEATVKFSEEDGGVGRMVTAVLLLEVEVFQEFLEAEEGVEIIWPGLIGNIVRSLFL